MQPTYDIQFSSGESLKSEIRNRIHQVSVIDEVGMLCDTCEIVLEDAKGELALPTYNAQVIISLGYNGDNRQIGTYFLDDVMFSSSGILKISGKGFDSESDLKTIKSKTFLDKNVFDLIKSIASIEKLNPKIDANLKNIVITEETIEQRHESILHFITRICEEFNLTFKIQGENLLVKKKGSKLTFSGQELPTIEISPKMLSSWDISRRSRSKYQSVSAPFYDIMTGDEGIATAGSGKPHLLLKEQESRNRAEQLCAITLEKNKRLGFSGYFEMRGDTRILVDIPLKLTGFRDGLDLGEWVVTQVEHSISRAGFITSWQAEKIMD